MGFDASDKGGNESSADFGENLQGAGRFSVEKTTGEASGSRSPKPGPKRPWIFHAPQTTKRVRALLAVVVTAAAVLLGVTAVTSANADPGTVVAPVITSPSDGSTVSTLPKITGTAGAGDTVTVSVDGTAQTPTSTVDANGDWTYQATSPLTNGSHAFTATESDSAGDVSAASDPVTVTVGLPAPVITSPANGAALVPTLPKITGTATAGNTVTVSINGTAQSPTVTADANGDWSYQVTSPLTDGSNTFTATQSDSAGNTSPASDPTGVTVTLVAPTITSPTVNTTIGTQPKLVGTALAGNTVTLTVDGTVLSSTIPVDGNGDWSYQVADPLTSGSHTFIATQSDSAGNVSGQSNWVYVGVNLNAPTITSPTAGTIVSSTPTIIGTAVAGDTVTVYLDGTAQTPTTTADGNGNWSYTVSSPLSDGAHTITASQTDTANNTSVSSSPINVTVGPVPISPTVNPTDGTTVTGTAIAGDTVTVTDTTTKAQVGGTVTVGADGAWTVTPGSQLSKGDVLSVVDTNPAGASSVATSVTVGNGIPDLNWSYIALSTGTTVANGTNQITATVRLVDLNGNGLSGLTVMPSYTADTTGATASTTFPDGVTVSPVTSVADSNTYTFTLSSTEQVSGQVGASFVANGTTYSLPNLAGISFTAAADVSQSFWTLGTVPSTNVDTAPQYQIVVELWNSGNRIPSLLSGISVNASGATVTGFTQSSTGGVYWGSITSQKAGSYPITVTYDGQTIAPQSGTPTSAVFTAGAASPVVSLLSVTTGAQLANGTDAQVATATVTDQFGNPVANAPVDFSLQEASGAGFVVGSAAATPTATVTTNSNGLASVAVSATTGGSYHVVASLSGTPISGSPAATSFVTGTVNADASSWALGAASPSTDVDNSPSYPVTITLVGTDGAPVAGAAGDLTVTAPSGVTISPVTDKGNGTYSATVSSTTAGSFPVTVSLASGAAALPIGSAQQAVFTAGAAVSDKSTLTVTTNPAVANGTDTQTATVLVVDQFGNPVSGETVDFSTNENSAASFTGGDGQAAHATTGADGTATAELTATTPGSYQVNAEVDSGPVGGSPATTSFSSGPVSTTSSSWTLGPSSGRGNFTTNVDSNPAYPVTITLNDESGQPVTGAASNISITTTATSGVTVSAVTDNGNGSYSASITGTKAGSFPVSVSVNDNPLTATSGSLSSVTFTAGAVNTNVSTLSVTGVPAVANGVDTQPVTVVVTDQYSNPIANTTVTLNAGYASGVGFVTANGVTPTATLTTDSTGTAQVKMSATTGGNYRIWAQMGDGAVIGYYPAAVASFSSGVPSATASSWWLEAPPTTDVTSSPAPGYAAVLTLLDANGNRVTGAVSDITVNASGATVSGLGETSTGGVYSFYVSSTKPGVFPVTVSVPGGQVGATTVATFTSGSAVPATSLLTVSHNTALANSSDTQSANVYVADPAGNPVNGAPVTFSLQEASGAIFVGNNNQPVSTVSTTSGWQGGASVNLTASTPGTYHVIATVNGAAIPGSPAVVSFASGTAVASNSSWTISSPSSTNIDDNPVYTVTATLKDINGTPVTGAASYLSIGAYGATSSPITDNGNGTYTATITSATAGTYNAGVSIGSSPVENTDGTTSVPVVFTPGTPSLGASGQSSLAAPGGTVLADGSATQTVTATVRDHAGNPISGQSVDFAVTSGSGDATLTSAGDSSGGSGDSNGSGTSTSGTSVSATTNASGVATVTVTDTSAETATVSALLNDQALNPASVPVVFVSEAPAAPTVNPTTGTTLTGTAGPASTVTVTDATGTLGTTTADLTGAFQVVFNPALAAGDALSVTASNAAGTSPATPVTVGGGVANPASSSWSLSPAGPVTASTGTYTVTITLVDGAGQPLTGQAAQIRVSASGASVGQVEESSTLGTYTATISSSTVGSFPVTVSLGGTPVDPASGSATSAVFTGASPAAPGAPSIGYPSDGATVIPLTYVQGYGAAGDTVTPYVDGVAQSPTVTVDAAGNWRYDFETALTNGSHTFTATQADAAGQSSVASDPVSVTVALPAPTIEIPSNNATVLPLLYLQGQTGAGDIVTVYVDGVAQTPAPPADANGNWSYTFTTALTSGSHVLTATAKDSVGNVSVASDPVTVNVALPAPTILIPSDSSTVSSLPFVQGSGAAGDTVTLLVDGTAQTPTATVDANGNWSYYFPTALSDGSHVLTATETDSVGNVSAASAPVSVTVQSAAPPAPPAAPVITAPANGSTVTTATPTISGTGVAGATVTVSDASGALAPTATVAANGTWSLVPSTALANGSYTFTATQSNANGTSVASAGVRVAVSVTPPPSGGGSSSPSLGDVINAIVNVITTIVKTIVSVVVSIRNLFSW